MSPEQDELFKIHKNEYIAAKKPTFVKTTLGKYLMITGRGVPWGEVFRTRAEALQAVAEEIRIAKRGEGQEFKIPRLEGLWWTGRDEPGVRPKSPIDWNWKLVIRIPESISKRDLTAAIVSSLGKGNDRAVKMVEIERFREGLSIQMLHVGPLSQIERTLAQMKEVAEDQGVVFHGLLHEIYLSDSMRVPEDRLKTILRIPVK